MKLLHLSLQWHWCFTAIDNIVACQRVVLWPWSFPLTGSSNDTCNHCNGSNCSYLVATFSVYMATIGAMLEHVFLPPPSCRHVKPLEKRSLQPLPCFNGAKIPVPVLTTVHIVVRVHRIKNVRTILGSAIDSQRFSY